jgi:hypothetical protein
LKSRKNIKPFSYIRKVSVKCEDEEIPLSKYIMEGVWGESIDDAIERRALEENNSNGE